MSKRFTETEKWSDKWFRKLSPIEKLLFLYFIDNCDSAGFIEMDEDLISFHTGLTPDEILGASKGLTRGCAEADGWFWVKNFLRHQKCDVLNSENNAHKPIIQRIKDQIKRFYSNEEFRGLLGANKGLFSPTGLGEGLVLVLEKGLEEKGSGEKQTPTDFLTDAIFLEKQKKEFAWFWQNYDKKIGLESTVWFHFQKLTDPELQKIRDHLPEYVKHTEKAYRKNPLNYITDKAFNDEIIIKTNGTDKSGFKNNAGRLQSDYKSGPI